MTHNTEQPMLTAEGVAFTVVTIEFSKHHCIISKDALSLLAKNKSGDFGPIEIFKAYEAKICGVARRLIAAGVNAAPLRIESYSFN